MHKEILKLHYCHKFMFKKFLALSFIFIISGCSSVVEPIKISDLSPDPKLQEQFSIEVLPLTFSTAEELNSQEFSRLLSLPDNNFSPRLISEQAIERKNFPHQSEPFSYRLGVGDVLSFMQARDPTTQTITVPQALNAADEQNPLAISPPMAGIPMAGIPMAGIMPIQSPNLISTRGRIGTDGSILLIGIGRLEAKGRHINDLRDEVRSILIRNGNTPDFQLEIEGFYSQKAYITTDAPPDQKPDQIQYIMPITDRGVPLREILATAGIAFNQKIFTFVKIQRGGKTYSFSLSDLFAEDAPQIFLQDQDHVFIQNLEYVNGKVFLVGGVKPKLLEIQPEKRQTLGEILFSPQGPLEQPSAQRSAVYLLRGRSPIKAYHLDAQDPSRILVADAVEMRPNDIVYVAEQPINTFNRVLDTILPLRIFSRDVKNDNLP